MRSAAFALAAVLALAGGTVAQSVPNFSGTWRLDLSRSDAAAHNDGPGPVHVTIVQTDATMRVDTTTARGTTSTTYRFASKDPVSTDNPLARWRGDTLLTDAVRDVRGQSVTVQQTRRLSGDGNEMIVESVVNVQHGYSLSGSQTYSTSKDVFVKVKP
jgi:hypothetical protein